jgi:rhamnogalacturonyl hydrolase YesR
MTPPLADQYTAVSPVLLTSAENWMLAPGATVGFPGVIWMDGLVMAVLFVSGLDAAAGVIADEHPTVASMGRKMIPAKTAL